MVSERSYSPGMPPTAALYELRRCAGSQFDPTVVEAFCDAWAKAGVVGASTEAA